VAALEAFLCIATQWRMAGLADGTVHITGLDYTAARAGLELAGVDMTPALWTEVRTIEIGARAAMNGQIA
jgi:hypothetical protein